MLTPVKNWRYLRRSHNRHVREDVAGYMMNLWLRQAVKRSAALLALAPLIIPLVMLRLIFTALVAVVEFLGRYLATRPLEVWGNASGAEEENRRYDDLVRRLQRRKSWLLRNSITTRKQTHG